MIDCKEYKNKYLKMIFKENQNLAIEQIARTSGTTPEDVLAAAQELKIDLNVEITPENYEKLVVAAQAKKDMNPTKTTRPELPPPPSHPTLVNTKESVLNEQDPVEEDQPVDSEEVGDAEGNSQNIDMNLLYTVIFTYGLALQDVLNKKENTPAIKFLNTLNNIPLLQKLINSNAVAKKALTYAEQDAKTTKAAKLNTVWAILLKNANKVKADAAKAAKQQKQNP